MTFPLATPSSIGKDDFNILVNDLKTEHRESDGRHKFYADTPPTSPYEGQLWYDLVSHVLKFYNGSTWKETAIVEGLAHVGLSDMPDPTGINTDHDGRYVNIKTSSLQTLLGDLSIPNLITAGLVDGRDISVDGAKLDTIEPNAKDDQIAIEVPFTPYGRISAVDVQNALQELDDEKFDKIGGVITGDVEVPNLICPGLVDGVDVSTIPGLLDLKFDKIGGIVTGNVEIKLDAAPLGFTVNSLFGNWGEAFFRLSHGDIPKGELFWTEDGDVLSLRAITGDLILSAGSGTVEISNNVKITGEGLFEKANPVLLLKDSVSPLETVTIDLTGIRRSDTEPDYFDIHGGRYAYIRFAEDPTIELNVFEEGGGVSIYDTAHGEIALFRFDTINLNKPTTIAIETLLGPYDSNMYFGLGAWKNIEFEEDLWLFLPNSEVGATATGLWLGCEGTDPYMIGNAFVGSDLGIWTGRDFLVEHKGDFVISVGRATVAGRTPPFALYPKPNLSLPGEPAEGWPIDLGKDAEANRWRDLFLKGYISVIPISAPSSTIDKPKLWYDDTADEWRYFKKDGTLMKLTATAV